LLADVPRREAELVSGSPDAPSISIPVEALGDDGAIVIALESPRMLRIVGAAEGTSAAVVDAEDRPLEVELLVGPENPRVRRLVPRDGSYAPCRIGAQAAAVLLETLEGGWTRIPIQDDANGLARAMLPR
jgi:hypothetical protein